MLTNYLLITFRNIMKNKIPVFINVLGLGIATACCIVAYLNLDFNRSFDRNQAVPWESGCCGKIPFSSTW